MKYKVSLFVALCIIIISCNKDNDNKSNSAILPDVPEIVNYIGDWYDMEEDELCYRIYKHDNGTTLIEIPPNEMWWFTFDNIRMEEGVLAFDEYHYTENSDEYKSIVTPDGKHPFSGVRCEISFNIDTENHNIILMSLEAENEYSSEPLTIDGKLIRKIQH